MKSAHASAASPSAAPYADAAPVVVLGAGPAGLGAAYHLAKAGKRVVVLEREPRVGGMGATIKHKDYFVDYGPHTFHLKPTPVTRLFVQLSGADVVRVNRNAKLWVYGKTLPFPLRIGDALTRLNPVLAARILLDFAFERSVGRLRYGRGWQPRTFEEWGMYQFGRTLYRLAFGNYSEKMWGLPGSKLSVKLAKQKLVGLNLWNLVLAALGLLDRRQADAMGLSQATLYDAYPKYGIGTFFESLAQEIRRFGGRVELCATPASITVADGRATHVTYTVDGQPRTIPCESLVSSIPLPALCPLLPESAFGEAREAASQLRYRSLIVVHLVLRKEKFSDSHWTYLLDPRLVSNRLSEQKNLSPDSCPAGQTVVTLDITCDLGDYMWRAEDAFLISLAMHDVSLMGLHPRTVLDAFVLRAPNVYPIYSLGFERQMDAILGQLRQVGNLLSIGRHGLLLNNDMHDSIEMGFFAGEMLLQGRRAGDWYDTAERYVRERLEGIVRDPIRFETAPAQSSEASTAGGR